MKQIRMGVIAILAMVGLVLLASEPSDEARWFAVMFWKSVGGLGCWGVAALLSRRWGLPEEMDDVEI